MPPGDYDPPLQWLPSRAGRTSRAGIRYTGPLARHGHRLVLHAGYDNWSKPLQDLEMERADEDTWTVEIDTAAHLVVDCVVLDSASGRYDNNDDANYRLWIGFAPIDAHVHASAYGSQPLGFGSLCTALSSGGITHAVLSWHDNQFTEQVSAGISWLSTLIWVSPSGPSVEDVRDRFTDGAVGIKLHPAYDRYPADGAWLDPYLRAAADAGVPVTVHSGPGPADPALIRRLAERFPDVQIVLYHTFLGLPEGRRRASRYARELPNLHLETSWCRSAEVELLIDEVGPDRVLFGSDAAIDGPQHFVRQPPNIELTENYNEGLLRLAQRLSPDVFRKFIEENARRLFRLH